MIHVRQSDYEEKIWEEFSKSKSATLYYADNDRNVKFIGLIAGINEIYKGMASFYAGYLEADNTLADNCNIPTSVFKGWFSEFSRCDWNAAESWHEVPVPNGYSDEAFEVYLEDKFTSLGFIWDDNV